MLIELGNHASLRPGLDDRPKVTTFHVPEADEDGLGGYTHEVGGIKAKDLKEHLVESVTTRRGTTQLPGHEVLVSLLHPLDGAWAQHGADAPAWVHVTPHDLTPDGRAEDIEKVLCDYFDRPSARRYFGTKDVDELHVKKELGYWTRTPPGELPGGPQLPPLEALFTNDGRVISNVNDGGGQVGAIGVGSAATATGLTVSGTPGWASNAYAGYRIVAYSTASNNLVWGNITANGTGTNPPITVDRWYNFATPGGGAGTTPGTPWAFAILDGGFASTWFVGLATGANAPAAADHTLATNGNVEIVTAGGGLVRKIAPYAQTSGVASRALTLTPVFTANGSDTLPATVTTIGVFCSMVVGVTGTMKFETALTPSSATLSASGDQLTITETITGS